MPDEELEIPIPGHVRLPDEHSTTWLPLLRDLYWFESPRVSGPGSEHRTLEGVIWSKDDVLGAVPSAASDPGEFDELLGFLLERRQAMAFPAGDEGPERYITRVGELVRSLGHTYEYWWRGRPGVTATRWLVEDKMQPERSIPATEFRDSVVGLLEELSPGNQGSNLRTAAKSVCEAVAKSIAKGFDGDWREVNFSKFQLQSTRKILKARYGPNSGNKAQVLTAGVGSGKTIGFSIAALIEAYRSWKDASSGNQDHLTISLFVYPRTQLARDQYDEISSFASEIDGNMSAWLELYETYENSGRAATQGVVDEYGGDNYWARPKPVIVTTYETLKRRMRRPEFMDKISKHVSTIVLDEIHLTSGVSGGMAAYLLSRLTASAKRRGRPIYWIGASATIARPDLHASKLFGLDVGEIGVVDPSPEELVQAGINHHLFIRPTQGMSTMGVLVNSTSKLLHHRRDDLFVRDDDDEKRAKTIGFADNLELLGRWNDDLRENERTLPEFGKYGRKHPSSDDINGWGVKQRELPYALRFHKPLQRRLNSKGGKVKAKDRGDALEDLSGVFDSEPASTVCDRCMAGERTVLGEISPRHMGELSKLVHRHPHKESDAFKAFRLKSDEFHITEPVTIGSHEMCPMLRAGACSWFPRPNLEKTYQFRPGNYQSFEWASAARSTVISGKSNSGAVDGAESLSSRVFRETVRRVYQQGPKDKRIPVDIVLASPSLEVGVDIKMLTESMMNKAVRNIASYRQKAGRVGRENNLDAVNVSLMTDTAVDLHYYRQPRKLVSEGRLEPVPLMDRNNAVKACSAYGAVWEWLALETNLPEWIQGSEENWIGPRLRHCKDELDGRLSEVIEHVHSATKESLLGSQETVNEAIEQVRKELCLLLKSAKGTYDVAPNPGFEYTVADLFSLHKRSISSQGHGSPLIGKRLDGVNENDVDQLTEFTGEIENHIREIGIERFIEDNPELYKQFSELSYLLKRKALGADAANEVLESIGSLGDSEESLANAPAFVILKLRLGQICEILGRFEQSGYDLQVDSMFEEYKELDFKEAAYLSQTLEGLTMVSHYRRDTWFVRPSTLFQNPYTPQVELVVKSVEDGDYADPIRPDGGVETVPLGEALFGFLPGTWTHRIPHRRLKGATGPLVPKGGRLVASVASLARAGNEFRKVHDGSLPAPPGSPNDVRVWAPTKLALFDIKSKYVLLDKTSSRIMDHDEQSGREGGSDPDSSDWSSKEIRIPKSFQNRWSWAEPGTGEEIGAFKLRFHSYTEEVEGDDEREMGDDEVLHPLRVAMMDSIQWHEELEVVEYTYSNSRQYSGSGDIEVGYEDEHGRSVAFGQKYKTEGFSIKLRGDIVDSICEKITTEFEEGKGTATPSLIKAFKAHISSDTQHGGAGLGIYALEDLVSVLLIFSEWDGEGISRERWCEIVSEASDVLNEARVRGVATNFYTRKLSLMRVQSDDEEEEGEDEEGDDEIATNRASELMIVLGIVSNSIGGFGEGLGLWAHRTVLSTLGSSATTALQQFSGSDENDMGYLIDPHSWDGEDYRVTLYDRAQYGNGSCATARDYMHIPHVCRYSGNAEGSRLPSTDFLSTLEERLLQCMQHQSDMGALALHGSDDDGSESDEILRLMPDLRDHADEAFSVGGRVWSRVGVEGVEDAWTLPLHLRLATHYQHTVDDGEGEIWADDIIRACKSCWNGCPECVDSIKGTLGGVRGLDYVDKYVSDGWFLGGIAESDDYGIHDFESVGHGTADMHLGSLNRMHLVTPDEVLRSICLPWTMGFVTQREGNLDPRLVMRNTDVSGLRIGSGSGTAHGIESHGFRRLLWFNLLMTGHLDAIGAIKERDRKLQLLYFDARDLYFDDVGLSPRMLDSMLAVHGSHIENLSDVLRWMLQRGFKIKLCIDRGRASEAGVHEFLTAIGTWPGFTVMAMPRSFEGNMHKKDLITPIAALSGSANLTYSGSERNRETIAHVMRVNETEYESLAGGARTLFRNAIELDLDNIEPRIWRSAPTTIGADAGSRVEEPVVEEEPVVLNRVDRLIEDIQNDSIEDEGIELEFKSSFCKSWRIKAKKKEKGLHIEESEDGKRIAVYLEHDVCDIVLSEVASMLNTDGGLVVVGISDPKNTVTSEWVVSGLDKEINSKGGPDKYMQLVSTTLCTRFGTAVTSNYVRTHLKTIENKKILIFEIEPCRELPAWLDPKGPIMKRKTRGEKMLWTRVNDSSREIVGFDDIKSWIDMRFTQ